VGTCTAGNWRWANPEREYPACESL
jgi:hypothetical protein